MAKTTTTTTTTTDDTRGTAPRRAVTALYTGDNSFVGNQGREQAIIYQGEQLVIDQGREHNIYQGEELTVGDQERQLMENKGQLPMSCGCYLTRGRNDDGDGSGGVPRHEVITNGWWLILTIVVVSALLDTASARCRKETELWAYTNPSNEVYQDSYQAYKSSDSGDVCKWVVIAANKEWMVKLKFDPFILQNSTKNKEGDCLEIFDGDSEEAPLLDKICNRKPKHSYTSEGRKLFVVYTRGNVNGNREIGFVYQSVSADSQEQLIRIAGIVGGSLAAVGIVYLIIRYTHCFNCLRKKNGEEPNETRSNNHTNNERDRLTGQTAMEEGEAERGRTTVLPPATGAAVATTASAANGSTVINSNDDGTTNTPASDGDAVGGDNSPGSDSDSDSLHTLNEPPPSYESLYLNEDGIEPPQYTPPKHQVKNPPRRVHTFN